jgi:hypothetical protein
MIKNVLDYSLQFKNKRSRSRRIELLLQGVFCAPNKYSLRWHDSIMMRRFILKMKPL